MSLLLTSFLEHKLHQINTNTLIQLLVATIVAVFWIFKIVGSKSSSKGSSKSSKTFSGIVTLPVLSSIFQILKFRKDLPGVARKWREKYGTNWRITVFGRDLLVIHDPSLLKVLLSSTNIGHLEKDPYIYKKVSIGASVDGLITMPAKNWANHRKVLNPIFTHESLKSYIKLYVKHAQKLVEKFETNGTEEQSNNCGPLDTNSYSALIHTTCLDIISEITTGIPFEDLLGQSGALKFYEDVSQALTIFGNKFSAEPWLQIPIVWRFHPQRKKLDRHTDGIETAMRQIRRIHVPQPDSKFALDLMINSKWSDDEILSEMVTFIIAGHETVSNTFKFLLWMLALEENHQITCQEEVDKVFDSTENSYVGMTMSDFSSIKYLERCIKETLRLFPVLTFGTTRNLQSPLKIDNSTALQPETVFTYSPYLLHRDPSIYPDPEKFDPNRFLSKNVKVRHLYSYLPFSAGPRNCIGWKLAQTELTVLSAFVIRNFKLSTTDKREDIQILPKMILHTSKEPNIIFQKRR